MRLLIILQSTGPAGLWERLRMMGSGAQGAAVDLLLAVSVVVVAVLVATVLSSIVRFILGRARLREGVRKVVGPRTLGAHDPASLAAWGTRWLIIAAGLVFAFDVLGLDLSASLADRMREVLPRVLAASFLLVAGVTAAMLLGAVTQRFFESAGFGGSRLRGQIVTGLFTMFALLLALEQLGFAAQFVMWMGIVLAGAAGLAVGLAFGLGCRDLARDFVVEYLRSLEENESSRP